MLDSFYGIRFVDRYRNTAGADGRVTGDDELDLVIEENEDAVATFLGSYTDFTPLGLELAGLPAYERMIGVQMTPLKTGCDGFYVAVLQRD